MRGLLRGLRQRAGLSAGILLVAIVAAAASTLGPAYDAAARTSVLQDSLHNQVPVTRTVQATNGGSLTDLAEGLAIQVNTVLAAQLGGTSTLRRLFLPPVEAVLAQVSARTGTAGGYQSPVTWRTDFCAHLTITEGTCPTAAGQVLVSRSYASAAGVKPGGTITTTSGYGTLRVTGEYAVPSVGELTSDPYWLSAQCDDFIVEDPCPTEGGGSGAQWDAVFASQATFNDASAVVEGNATVLDTLNPAGVRSSDINALASAVNEVNADLSLQADNISVTSSIPQLTGQVTSDWQTLDVPVFLISLQLLLLAWLLLFLIATEASEARAVEVALAKLRGYGRARTVAFGISELSLLLLTAFPVGALLGWAASAGLTRFLLRPGTPATLPWLAIAAAAVSTLGGFVAVIIAARRTIRRPVTEQWQRTSRDAGRRGWLLDGVLLTGAVAGLAELLIGGNVSSTRSGSLGLLVPGLLGLAVAVVASRALPAGWRPRVRVDPAAGRDRPVPRRPPHRPQAWRDQDHHRAHRVVRARHVRDRRLCRAVAQHRPGRRRPDRRLRRHGGHPAGRPGSRDDRRQDRPGRHSGRHRRPVRRRGPERLGTTGRRPGPMGSRRAVDAGLLHRRPAEAGARAPAARDSAALRFPPGPRRRGWRSPACTGHPPA